MIITISLSKSDLERIHDALGIESYDDIHSAFVEAMDIMLEKEENKQDKTMIDNKEAKEHLEAMKAESLQMIQATKDPSVKKAWHNSHLGSLDFAKEMGFISEEQRIELYKEFNRAIEPVADLYRLKKI